MFAVRKDGFKDHPIVPDGLDLVEESDQITHLISLDDDIDPQTSLDVFKLEKDFEENEKKYAAIKVWLQLINVHLHRIPTVVFCMLLFE